MSLLARFARHFAALSLGDGPLVVAVSGGVDSVVLLDLLTRLPAATRPSLVVAHLDHGIHPDSQDVARAVARLARSDGLPFVAGRIALGADATESLARRERHRWLRQVAREHQARWIVLAHQADDQDETVLMRALAGSGPAGLAGMPARAGHLVRPLLPFRRATLLRYARARGLQWWEDPANADPRHLRSFLRISILPALAGKLPRAGKNLASLRRQARSGRNAWQAALRLWPGLGFRRQGKVSSVGAAPLFSLPQSLRLALTQALVRAARGPAGPARIARAIAALEKAPSGATADLGSGWRLELTFDRLRVLAPRPAPAQVAAELSAPAGQTEWGGWGVRWVTEPAPARQVRTGHTAWFVPGTLRVRPWRPGDRLAPLGGVGGRLAVRCFQDARVPRSNRATWPMLEREGELTWIPGVCRSNRLLPEAGEPAIRVDMEPPGD